MKNDKSQENISRPVIIDARARYRAAARRLKETALDRAAPGTAICYLLPAKEQSSWYLILSKALIILMS
jgi:hypothetical protein